MSWTPKNGKTRRKIKINVKSVESAQTKKICNGCLRPPHYKTHFYFNGKIYSQCNRVSMGSPLGPLLADIYLIHLENEIMKKLKENGLVFYKR